MSETLVRLSKLMAQKGLCSRREADVFIEKGWVFVDGLPISTLGTKVSSNAQIELNSKAQKVQSKKLTFLIHKPLGIVSCQPEKNYSCAIDLLKDENQEALEDSSFKLPSYLPKLAVAGRLDIDSTGLLVITQDGRIAKSLIEADSKIEKEYIVKTHENITTNQIKQLSFGLFLDDKPLKKAEVKLINPKTFKIILKEGRKRQIRRMCELVGLEVYSLKRVRIGQIKLGELGYGKWRLLGDQEQF